MAEQEQPASIAFGQRLRELRIERGVSQEALAHRVGLDRTAVTKLERSAANPRLSTVLWLAHGLDVPPEALVRGLAWTGPGREA